MAGVVLDPLAEAHLLQHLDIEKGPLLDALGLHQHVLLPEPADPLLQFQPDLLHGPLQGLPGRHVVGGGIDGNTWRGGGSTWPPEAGRSRLMASTRVAEELDPVGPLVVMGRKDLHDVSPHPEGPAVEVHVIPFVLDLHQFPQQVVPAVVVPLVEEDVHGLVRLGGADAVDAGDRGDDDHVPPGEEAPGGGMAQLVDLVVDGGILFDVGVGGGEVGLGLVVIVVGDEVLDGVVGEELLELAVELGRQGLVGGDDQGRPVHRGNDVGHGKGLAGTGDPEQHLVPVAAVETGNELFDSEGLIPLGGVG